MFSSHSASSCLSSFSNMVVLSSTLVSRSVVCWPSFLILVRRCSAICLEVCRRALCSIFSICARRSSLEPIYVVMESFCSCLPHPHHWAAALSIWRVRVEEQWAPSSLSGVPQACEEGLSHCGPCFSSQFYKDGWSCAQKLWSLPKTHHIGTLHMPPLSFISIKGYLKNC